MGADDRQAPRRRWSWGALFKKRKKIKPTQDTTKHRRVSDAQLQGPSGHEPANPASSTTIPASASDASSLASASTSVTTESSTAATHVAQQPQQGCLPDASPAAPVPAAGADSASPAPAAGVDTTSPAPAAGAHSASPAPAGRCLMVHVLHARRLRAADSNGLSDPYCVVQVGGHKASSRTELKTLCPLWNEVMAFSPADVADALSAGRPHVALRVFDWDLISADDFLGQAEVPLAEVGAEGTAGEPAEPRWLPLYAPGRGGRREDAGEIQVAVWYGTAGGAGEEGGGAVSTLCSAPSLHRHGPSVVHSRKGVLYEEPLVACLAVTLQSVQSAADPAGGSNPGTSAATSSPAPPQSHARTHRWMGHFPGSHFLGGLLRRRSSGGPAVAQHAASRCTSGASDAADELMQDDFMLAGEDPGDEYGLPLPEFLSSSQPDAADSGQDGDVQSPVAEARPPGSAFISGLDQRLRRRSAGSTASVPLSASPPGLLLSAVPEDLSAAGDGQQSEAATLPATAAAEGARMYMRLVLGRQNHTSYIKRLHADGSAHWQQTFVFAVPLPLRDRQLRLELYCTPKCTKRGRLVSVTHVSLLDLVPSGLEDSHKAVQQTCAELEGVLKRQPAGSVHLSSTLVDTDHRRKAYQVPFVPAADSAAAAPGEAQGAGQGLAGPPLPAGAGLQRLESVTEEWSDRELLKKALHSEGSFEAWRDSKHNRAREAARGVLPAALEAAQWLAYKGRRRISSVMAGHSEIAAAGSSLQEGSATQQQPQQDQVPRPLPQPAGRLNLTVDSLTLPGVSGAEVFFVLKCGQFWGRSALLPCPGGDTVSCGWRLSLPLQDPAALLTLAVFQQPPRSPRGPLVLRPGLLVKDAVRDAFVAHLQMVGRLRVRLSCLLPNAEVSSELPLLGERAKGARVAGSARLTLQASHGGMKALVKGYVAPRLPTAAYVHGIASKPHQAVLVREQRRICLRWLDSANPAIPAAAAAAVLGTEREAFVLSRAKVNVRRIRMALVAVRRLRRQFHAIKTWEDPRRSGAAVVGVLLLCFLPRLMVPVLLAWLVFSTLTLQPPDFGLPMPMEQDPPGHDPEHESLDTGHSNPVARLRAQVDRLQRLGLLVQNALDDVASCMERAQALLSWQDPTATLLVVCVLSVVAVAIFLVGLPTVLAAALCFVIRPPALRTPHPPVPVLFFARLPTRGDRIV